MQRKTHVGQLTAFTSESNLCYTFKNGMAQTLGARVMVHSVSDLVSGEVMH